MARVVLRADEREELIVEHMPLVRGLAGRYANRGEHLDDLVQAGMVGLIKAVDRFDPAFGVELSTFATPTILGELRRHFRDRTWVVRAPRGLQELRARVNSAIEALSAERGRSPTPREIADEIGVEMDEVLDALAAASAHRPDSLSPSSEHDAAPEVPASEDGYELAEARLLVAGLLPGLPARERAILHLRFEHGLSQQQIGRHLGISQMHVSRLLRKALDSMADEAGGLAEGGS